MFECFLYGDAACQRFEYPADELEYLTGEDPTYFDHDNTKAKWFFSGLIALGAAFIIAMAVMLYYKKLDKKRVAYVELLSEARPVPVYGETVQK
jgi:hypothetical protein